MDKEQVIDAAAAVGLVHGRMVDISKSRFIREHPDRAVIFGADLCDAAGNDLWHGDLDLTVDEERLLQLAAALGEPLFAMTESALFHEHHGIPRTPATQAWLVVTPDGTSSVPESSGSPFERGPDGRLVVPLALRGGAGAGASVPGDPAADSTTASPQDDPATHPAARPGRPEPRVLDADRVRNAAAALGLHHGRMISGSKSGHRRQFPLHEPMFNAYLVDGAGTELWWGDLDLTLDEPRLLDLVAALGAHLFVIAESSMFNRRMGTGLLPARDAVLVLAPDRTASEPDGSTWHFARDAAGRIARPPRPPADPEPEP